MYRIFHDIEDDELGSTMLAQRVMGFDSSFHIALIIIGIGFAQVVIVTIVIIIKLKNVIDATSLQQQSRNRERVIHVIQSQRILRHPAVFITYEDARKQGRFIPHEEAREAAPPRRLVDWLRRALEAQVVNTSGRTYRW